MSKSSAPGFWRILFNVLLVFLTGGLWLLWLLVKYLIRK